MHKCSDLPPYEEPDGRECYGSLAAGLHNDSQCINWNQYYTDCKPGENNPFAGAISFDNIGLAWVAIFLVRRRCIKQVSKCQFFLCTCLIFLVQQSVLSSWLRTFNGKVTKKWKGRKKEKKKEGRRHTFYLALFFFFFLPNDERSFSPFPVFGVSSFSGKRERVKSWPCQSSLATLNEALCLLFFPFFWKKWQKDGTEIQDSWQFLLGDGENRKYFRGYLLSSVESSSRPPFYLHSGPRRLEFETQTLLMLKV